MKKTFTIEDLDCPNCAAKLEAALKGIRSRERIRQFHRSETDGGSIRGFV